MEYFVKGRGTLCTKKERIAKPSAAASTTAAATKMGATSFRFAGIVCAMAELDWAAAIPLLDPGSWTEANDPLTDVARPESVSRLRRFKSARISAALW